MTSNRSSTVTGTIKVQWTFKPRHNRRRRKDDPGIGPRDIEPGNVARGEDRAHARESGVPTDFHRLRR